MLNRYSALILGTVLGLGTLAFSGAGASAMLPLAPIASGEANAVGDGIVRVEHMNNGRGMNWNKKNFNNWCNNKSDGCYHKHRRHHFDRSYLYLPLIIGGGYGAYNYYDDDYDDYDDYGDGYVGLSSAHVRWCLNRYRSYNLHTNLWVSFSGKKHQCISPYGQQY